MLAPDLYFSFNHIARVLLQSGLLSEVLASEGLGASAVGASVVGTSVVGTSVVGASVVGASVVGASVVGASVGTGSTLGVDEVSWLKLAATWISEVLDMVCLYVVLWNIFNDHYCTARHSASEASIEPRVARLSNKSTVYFTVARMFFRK